MATATVTLTSSQWQSDKRGVGKRMSSRSSGLRGWYRYGEATVKLPTAAIPMVWTASVGRTSGGMYALTRCLGEDSVHALVVFLH